MAYTITEFAALNVVGTPAEQVTCAICHQPIMRSAGEPATDKDGKPIHSACGDDVACAIIEARPICRPPGG